MEPLTRGLSHWVIPLCAAGTIILITTASMVFRSAAQKPLPPGPSHTFFGGNVSHAPKAEPWKVYAQWSKTWGSAVISLRMFGRCILVFNGAQVAEELLEKRSKNYADRPTWLMADLIGRQNNVGFTYYGDKLRASRRLLHASLGVAARDQWRPMIAEECIDMMKLIVDHPEQWMAHVKLHVASLVLRFTYGRGLTEEYARMAEEINLDTGMALQPGWIVDSFPLLKHLPGWLPGMHFKRWALAAKSRFERCTQEPYSATRLAVLNGTAPPSFVARHLTSIVNRSSPFDEQILMHTAGSVYGAATDTMTALLMSFILLMVVFQDVQEKAHAELAALVGRSRLPTLDDQASLPYIEALTKELHRFRPVVNLVPHSPMEDDEYEGYRIPRKLWIMCNVWSMTHDPEIYEDAEMFNPDRHLSGTVKDPRQFTFGFGRRSCPGIHFANDETFVFIACILFLFKIKPAAEVPPLSYTSTFTSQPTTFECQFQLRDPTLKELLHV